MADARTGSRGDDSRGCSVAGLSREELRTIEGRVFNIQPYSVHDGPGIRTTVFLSGCPLRCRWCQNPESWTAAPELFFYAEFCVGCGACIDVCTAGAVSLVEGKAATDRSLCNACGDCVATCPVEAREIDGMAMTAGEVADAVVGDELFLRPQGGGVTISGGEVLAQSRFGAAVMALVREQGLTSCIETSGHGPWESLVMLLEHTDLVLYDIKHMDSAVHEWGTGVGNELILENLRRIYHEARKPVRARIPVIPGFNDSDGNIFATCAFIRDELGPDVFVHLLPYHDLGESKRDRMEVPPEERFVAQKPSDERMAELLAIVQSFGLECKIGG